ncbi:MAG: S23 ribosomal protein [Candidatus Magasanikbacteria bacterium GW2011_GWC2_34_16]|uniref:S23 ribosomal protein n=2 Tax=Candidatus Magasanikiibacteriota TaxID=1752731 RepID=A0A0G0H923_9BACT|nr:MAG: S23 ribosomal protein [Candidatus Magasanikbacteria bacterium GW2011_GWC2_34_16]KKQ39753.1 MAG: S23 ribosomal protein [Candidatus Magasanikbacteria bacterium GW2011_GWA2_37_8]
MNQEGGKIKSFINLHSWQEGHKLVLEIYKLTNNFPKSEMFGLTNQMRRAVVSITSNIAEGFSRYSYKEKSQFYSISLGSLTELQNQLLIARDINYLSVESFKTVADRTVIVSKLINGLIKKTKLIILDS